MPSARSRSAARGRIVGPLTVVALGLSAGAMLAEAGLLVPWWQAERPEAFLAWYASNARRLFEFFAPFEVGAAGLAIAAAVRARRSRAFVFFFLAATLALAVLVPFPLYFARANASFADGSVGVANVAGELARWASWHWARTAIGIAAFISAIYGVRAQGID